MSNEYDEDRTSSMQRCPLQREERDPFDELEELDVSVLEIDGGHTEDDGVDVDELIGY